MRKPSKDTYDVIIIGAGISGLVCGCYLAKAGMKVLIAEQHFKPGGYCTSFKRKGFLFDAAAHSFGGYGKNGNMYRVLNELGLCEKIKIQRYDPSDVVVSPDHTISFWSDRHRTIRELATVFPQESRNIETFFHFLLDHEPADFIALRNKTFQQLLDRYFDDPRIKAILSLPVLGNGDLPPSRISAFTGAKIYSEFLLDGGYYPTGGMQMLSDMLAARFKEFGGELLLAFRATKIVMGDQRAMGVAFTDKMVSSSCVVANCDARQLFTKLIQRKHLNRVFLNRLKSMVPSQSMFVLYLGIKEPFRALPKSGTNVWFLPHYDIERLYQNTRTAGIRRFAEYYMVRVSPDRKTILAFVNAPFRTKQYWNTKKSDFMDAFIKQIETRSIPGLARYIEYRDAATPSTLHRYTLNYRGAAYGWAGTPSQFADPDLRKPSFVNGLYLTGHWTTFAQGIPGVAYIGYDTAKKILVGEKRRRMMGPECA